MAIEPTTHFNIQEDERSNITFGFKPSNTQYSILLAATTIKTIQIDFDATLVMVSVQGGTVYYNQGAVPPVIPTQADFTEQAGHLISSGAVKLFSFPANTLHQFISTSQTEIQLDFFRNEEFV